MGQTGLIVTVLVAGWLCTGARGAIPARYTPAEAALLARLRENPHDGRRMRELTQLLADRGEWDLARECLEILGEHETGRPELDVAIAKCLVHMGRRTAALDRLEAILAQHPRFGPALAVRRRLGVETPAPVEVPDLAAFRSMLEREHCLQVQQQAVRALADYGTAKGVSVLVSGDTCRRILIDLARFGYMARPWLPPAAGCRYATVPGGGLRCQVHGGAADLPAPPRLEQAQVAPELLAQALDVPTTAVVVQVAALALRDGRVDLLPALLAGLPVVGDAASLALAAERVAALLAFPGKAIPDTALRAGVATMRVVRGLVGAPEPWAEAAGALLALRLGHPLPVPVAGFRELVRQVNGAQGLPASTGGAVTAVEVEQIVRITPAERRDELVDYARTMPWTEAIVAIPPLVRLGYRPLWAALAERRRDLGAAGNPAAPVLLEALRETAREGAAGR